MYCFVLRPVIVYMCQYIEKTKHSSTRNILKLFSNVLRCCVDTWNMGVLVVCQSFSHTNYHQKCILKYIENLLYWQQANYACQINVILTIYLIYLTMCRISLHWNLDAFIIISFLSFRPEKNHTQHQIRHIKIRLDIVR